VANDWRQADLEQISARATVLSAHAEKLALHPASIDAEDIARLRDAGCSDRAVLELTHVVGFFSYYNRLADGLGIDPEPDW